MAAASSIDHQLVCAAVLMSVDACVWYCMDGQHKHLGLKLFARMRLAALGASREKARVLSTATSTNLASSTGRFNLLRWTPVKAPCLLPKP
jgi:hypothetical protein